MPKARKVPKVALFLGAGASRAFDYPTTLEFVTELKNVLTKEERRILDSILRSPEFSDIEHVLQTLDSIIEFSSNPYIRTLFKESHATVNPNNGRVVRSSISWNEFISLCQKLKETIIDELHSQYEFDMNKFDKIQGCYNSIDLTLTSVNKIPELHVFTTNYDSVFERFCIDSGREIEFSCGFITDFRSGRQFWDPDELKNWKWDKVRSQGIRLYKLHGSLDWRETVDNRIERVPTEEKVSRRTRRYKRNILIYPAQKNYAAGEPFRSLMKYFENVLNQHVLCLVIGFSFRDPLINNSFLDFLRDNRKRRLVVVSPSATKNVEENLIGGEKRLTKQIKCLNKPFGEDETFEAIWKALGLKTTEEELEEFASMK